MSDDILGRLRGWPFDDTGYGLGRLTTDAADEIERLRDEAEGLRAVIKGMARGIVGSWNARSVTVGSRKSTKIRVSQL